MENKLQATIDIGSHSCILLIAAFEDAPATAPAESANPEVETPAASRGESEPWRLIEEREYENGVTLRADACTRAIDASHRHSEILYDPSQHDEEFSKALEIGCPDGCTAADAERIWQDLARRRATAAAYPPVPDLETDASATPDGQEGQGGAATGYVVALAAIATVGMLIVAATFVRRKK